MLHCCRNRVVVTFQGTAGVVNKLCEERLLDLSNLKMVILDECDQMVSQGHAGDGGAVGEGGAGLTGTASVALRPSKPSACSSSSSGSQICLRARSRGVLMLGRRHHLPCMHAIM